MNQLKLADTAAQNRARTEQAMLTKQVFRLGELFAGAGGMALGAKQAKLDGGRFSHVWVNDIDKDACDTFMHNLHIPSDHVHCCDARELDFDALPPIDGLVFGFPCNDFSVVGDRHGISGNYGGLYMSGIHVLEAQEPLFFIAENVSGLASSGNDLKIILRDLEACGYNIFPHTYKFEQYGVPQNRHRIIIVGFRDDLDIDHFKHPSPTSLNKPITCRQALEGIGPKAHNNEYTKQSKIVVERLKHIRPGENVFTADLPEHLQLSMRSNAKISQVYRKLKPDQPAYTVTGSGGGGTHMYHWKENRALTNRERARLQTFPDSFEFLGGKESVRKQIGMAVPPKGAKVVFKAVLRKLQSQGIMSEC